MRSSHSISRTAFAIRGVSVVSGAGSHPGVVQARRRLSWRALAEPGVEPVGPGRRRSGVAAVTPGNCLLAAFPPAAARLGDVRGRAGAAARGVGRVRDGSPGRPPHNQLEAFRAQPPAFFIFPECYDYVQSRLASAKPFVIGKKSLFFSWICCALNVSVRYKP